MRQFWDIFYLPVLLETALRSGIWGILPSASTESEIVAAVEAIAFGLVILHPDAVELASIRQKAVTNPVQTLTPRKIEVLGMLGSGLGNKAMSTTVTERSRSRSVSQRSAVYAYAKRLHISEHTVKFHLSSIFLKLSVSSRTEAVAVGIRLGLIML